MGWLEILRHIPWGAWLPALLAWTGFILLCYFVMVCLITIFSKQWLENERMNLPLLQVPQVLGEATEKRGLGDLFSNRYLLAGLMIPLFLLSFHLPTTGIHTLPPHAALALTQSRKTASSAIGVRSSGLDAATSPCMS